MSTPHTLNFLQRVFSSKVNQIFPLDVVKIINNDKIEMENKMYNKKYNIINMFIKYYESLYYESLCNIKFDDFIKILNEEYNNKLLSNNNRKNYEPVFNNLNEELIIYYLLILMEEATDDYIYGPAICIQNIIELFSNLLEQNDEYNRLVLMYENEDYFIINEENEENNYQEDELQ